MGVIQHVWPWDSQPQEAAEYDQTALAAFGICGGFIVGGGGNSTPDSITGQPVVYSVGSGEYVRFDPSITHYGVGALYVDDDAGRLLTYRLGAVNSRDFTFMARVRAASATALFARSGDTGTGTTIPLWKNSGVFDMRINGTDYAGAGIWESDVWYDIEIVGTATSCVLSVNGATVINGGAAAAGNLPDNFAVGDVTGASVNAGGFEFIYCLWSDHALDGAQRAEIRGRPWQLFAPRQIYVLTAGAAAPTLPTLSALARTNPRRPRYAWTP